MGTKCTSSLLYPQSAGPQAGVGVVKCTKSADNFCVKIDAEIPAQNPPPGLRQYAKELMMTLVNKFSISQLCPHFFHFLPGRRRAGVCHTGALLHRFFVLCAYHFFHYLFCKLPDRELRPGKCAL